mgnify:CR=1 FL=1
MENYEYKYQGRDAVPDIIEAGEYVVEVIEAVLGVSNGAKTAGSRTLNLKLKEMESGATIWETLTEHPSIDFRIDTRMPKFLTVSLLLRKLQNQMRILSEQTMTFHSKS